MMRNLPVPIPSFLPQPCGLPPLLLTVIDAARLLGISRADALALANLGNIRRVEIDIDGHRQVRITTASVVAYVERLAATCGVEGKKETVADQITGKGPPIRW
jgi:hypothetical protein